MHFLKIPVLLLLFQEFPMSCKFLYASATMRTGGDPNAKSRLQWH